MRKVLRLGKEKNVCLGTKLFYVLLRIIIPVLIFIRARLVLNVSKRNKRRDKKDEHPIESRRQRAMKLNLMKTRADLIIFLLKITTSRGRTI